MITNQKGALMYVDPKEVVYLSRDELEERVLQLQKDLKLETQINRALEEEVQAQWTEIQGIRALLEESGITYELDEDGAVA